MKVRGYNADVWMCRCADVTTGIMRIPMRVNIRILPKKTNESSLVFTKPYEACIQGCLDFNVQSSRMSAVVFWFTIISFYRPPGPLEAYGL